MTLNTRTLSRSRASRHKGASGFTLTELMIAATIVGLIGAMLAQFTLTNSRLLFDSTSKIDISSDVRYFTADISRTARGARAFYIYPTYGSGQVATARRAQGKSGDFLVLVWVEPEMTSGSVNYSKMYYSRIVGYGRSAGTDGYGPVVRFEREFPSTDSYRTSAMTVEELVDQVLQNPDERQVLELAKGLANERLFYNYRDHSIVVNGQILHGNAARSVTNTYNFTISPRG